MMTQVYHKDIGFPAGVALPPPGTLLTYSKHALLAAKDDHLAEHELPPRLPDVFELIDMTVFGGRAVRWAVRFPFMRNVEGRPTKTGWDIILVVSFDGTVLTAYINRETDQHSTLRRERYAVPQGA